MRRPVNVVAYCMRKTAHNKCDSECTGKGPFSRARQKQIPETITITRSSSCIAPPSPSSSHIKEGEDPESQRELPRHTGWIPSPTLVQKALIESNLTRKLGGISPFPFLGDPCAPSNDPLPRSCPGTSCYHPGGMTCEAMEIRAQGVMVCQ